MKKNVVFSLLIIFVSLFVCAPMSTSAQSINIQNDNSITVPESNCHGIDANTALLGSAQLVDNVKSAVLFEANSETLMYAWNADLQLQPASFVKILTALIAIERGDLSETVIVSENAVSAVPYDAVSAELQFGEQLTLKDLLYCLLLGSANDAAVVIAEHISGNHVEFVQEMNEYALTLGCVGTNFTNAHGLHDENQYSTARDSGRILSIAMENQVFREIFTATEYIVPATNKSEQRILQSGNSLLDTTSKLYYDARVIGGRTGVTEDGRRCLAAVAESNGMMLVSIVMGSESVFQEDGYSAVSIGGYKETSALLDAGFSGYQSAQVLFANQTLRQYTVTNGDSDVIVGPQISVSTVLPDNVSFSDLSFRYHDAELVAPVEIGQKISDVEIWYGNMCVAKAELFAMNSVRHTEISTEKDNSDGSVGALSLWIILGIFAGITLAAAGFFVIKRVHKLVLKKRSRQYRRNRRRSR